jgi:hypothetical protein
MKSLLFQPLLFLVTASAVLAQAPANEHNCASSDGTLRRQRHADFQPQPEPLLPQLAPTPTGLSPLAFIVAGGEPGDRVDSQGSIYVVSIRAVPGGIDLWRWYSPDDGGANKNKTLPFR